MNFADLVGGESIFLDANTLIYHFGPHATFGPSCDHLMQQIKTGKILGFTSTPILSEVAHRVMTFEASAVFGWPSKVVDRLKQNPAALKQLTKFRQAVATVPQLGIRILTIPESLVEAATIISQQTGLLSNDALLIAVMQLNGLTNLPATTPISTVCPESLAMAQYERLVIAPHPRVCR